MGPGTIVGNFVGNLIQQNGNCGGVVTNTDPMLGPLSKDPLTRQNGGATPTMAITQSSSAFNNADPATSLATDQRGVPRQDRPDDQADRPEDEQQAQSRVDAQRHRAVGQRPADRGEEAAALVAGWHRDIEVHPHAQGVLDNDADPHPQVRPPDDLQVGGPGAAAHLRGTRVEHRRHLRAMNQVRPLDDFYSQLSTSANILDE